MSRQKKERPLNIMEYFNWTMAQNFTGPQEHHKYVSQEEQDFLQYVVYPMFYRNREQFRSLFPFPLVLEDYSSRYPKYVIDNKYFTIIFFSHNNYDEEVCWEVSVHIKDHNFCDERVKEFKSWYAKYYTRLFAEMAEMPKCFRYPKLNLYENKVQDFCIEFWNNGRNFMLFKLLDLFRLY